MNKILIVAGELSGDLHAARLFIQLKERYPHLELFSAAGDKTAQHSTQIFNLVNIAAMGIVEIIKYLPAYCRAFSTIEKFVSREKPKAVILVDFPDFNLRLARKLKHLSSQTKVIYYISPQVWAWRKNRIQIIKRWVDRMLVIFRFEEDFYRAAGVPAAFVGNPLLEAVKISSDYGRLQSEYATNLPITLMPGSREKVVRRHLPIFLKAAELIAKETNNARFFIIKPPHLNVKLYRPSIDKTSLPIQLIEEHTYDYIKLSKLALVSSGTATVETGILGTPFCIIYRMNPLSFFLLKPMLHTPYAGMINILFGKKVIEEFIQNRARPGLIAGYCLKLLKDPAGIREIEKNLSSLRSLLGEREWNQRTAVDILAQTLALE
jgi:lipid-A-disaccharide synthase